MTLSTHCLDVNQSGTNRNHSTQRPVNSDRAPITGSVWPTYGSELPAKNCVHG